MLVIRKEQIQTFQDKIDEDLATRIAKDIRENRVRGSRTIDDEQLRRRVDVGMERARKYQFTGKYQIAMFVELMFIVGPNFDEYPPIRAFLEDRSYSPNTRLDRMLDHVTDQQWESALQRSDPRRWQQ